MNQTEKSLLLETMRREGFCRIKVGGFSMLPAIRDGDQIGIGSLGQNPVRRGDIISFFVDHTLIAHRVFSIQNKDGAVLFHTQGDSFPRSDFIVNSESVFGKVLWKEDRRGRRSLENPPWTLEKSFLRSCLIRMIDAERRPSLSVPAPDWELIGALAGQNGMTAILAYCLEQYPEFKAPEHLKNKWRRNREDILAINLAYEAELKRLDSYYRGNDLVLLKGGALLKTAYPDISLRVQSDLDVLIKKENLNDFAAMLKDLGYTRHRYYANRFERGRLVIDLHFDLLDIERIHSRAFVFNIPPDYAQGFTLQPLEGYKNIKVLAPADNLIFYALHMMKHSYMQWIWFLDAALIIQKYRSHDFFPEVKAKAAQRGMARPVYYLSECLASIFGMDFSGIAERPPDFSRLESAIVGWVCDDRKIDMCGEILFFKIMKGLYRKSVFALEIVFLRPAVLREIYGSNGALPAVFLYPVRLLKIISFGVSFLKRIL